MKLTPKLINIISSAMEMAEELLDPEKDKDSLKVIYNWYKKVQTGDDLLLTARPKNDSF